MSKEVEFSAETKRRFNEIDPKDYGKEHRRLSRKLTETQFLYALLLFIGAITPLFALAMTAVNGGFALIWALLMAYAVIKAYRRIESPFGNLELREMIRQARVKAKNNTKENRDE